MKPNTRPASPYGLVFKSVSSIKGKLAGESCSFRCMAIVLPNSLSISLVGDSDDSSLTVGQEHRNIHRPGRAKLKPSSRAIIQLLCHWKDESRSFHCDLLPCWDISRDIDLRGQFSMSLAVTAKPKCLWWCKEMTIKRLLVKAEVLGGVSRGLMIDDSSVSDDRAEYFFLYCDLVYLFKLTGLTCKTFWLVWTI